MKYGRTGHNCRTPIGHQANRLSRTKSAQKPTRTAMRTALRHTTMACGMISFAKSNGPTYARRLDPKRTVWTFQSWKRICAVIQASHRLSVPPHTLVATMPMPLCSVINRKGKSKPIQRIEVPLFKSKGRNLAGHCRRHCLCHLDPDHLGRVALLCQNPQLVIATFCTLV